MEETYFLLNSQLSGDIPLLSYILCLAPKKALDYSIKSHLSSFPTSDTSKIGSPVEAILLCSAIARAHYLSQ